MLRNGDARTFLLINHLQKFGRIAIAELTQVYLGFDLILLCNSHLHTRVLDNTTSNNNPVHRSSFKHEDGRLVLTFVVAAVSSEKKRCHVFETGKGTKWMETKNSRFLG